MIDEYRRREAERSALGLPPLPLSADEVEALTDRLITASPPEDRVLLDLLTHRVAPGVGEAARAKAAFLTDVAHGVRNCRLLSRSEAVSLLATMRGGYNVPPLVALLDDPELATIAADQLARMWLVFDAFDGVAASARNGNPAALATLRAWAAMRWLDERRAVADEIHVTAFKVDGETNTDDFSPATEAWCRADIPLHARSFLANRLGPGRAASDIARLSQAGRPIAFVGDVVGTGSSRKSAVNSLLWLIGDDIAFVPNKREGGVVLATRIAPIFSDTLQDAGGLALECDAGGIGAIRSGDHLVLRLRAGRVESAGGDLLASFPVPGPDALDAVRAGGRLTLIIGRRLARQAGDALESLSGRAGSKGRRDRPGGPFTLAQKIVGRACAADGVAPGEYCEPVVSTVGSQDTTGPMNRTELEDLACLGFGADLVLQSFCHTAAYPKPADVQTQQTLPGFMASRGAVVLRPGDGILHSWLNRMLLPDQVGTGSDSHTRFPLGISFPAGSGRVAFAAALGMMPLTMPESVLVRFRGARGPGITVRDLVNAVPYLAKQQGLLGAFSGRIIEFEGLEDLTTEEAFELCDSTAERSAAACTFALSEARVSEHLGSGVELLRGLLDAGYGSRAPIERRIAAMEAWLAAPTLLRADPGAPYAAEIEIDLASVSEPLVACPNDPDDIRPLSAVAGQRVDEVFLGSCMTNLGHFRTAGRILEGRAANAELWIAPPTRMVQDQLRSEGTYGVYGAARARTEIPGCSLCMGNQARVRDGSTVVSTSTRNFPDRMGRDARVFLASAEVATLAATYGRLPTVEEYLAAVA